MSSQEDRELSEDTLHCRCKLSDRMDWVLAAREANLDLSKWVIQALNEKTNGIYLSPLTDNILCKAIRNSSYCVYKPLPSYQLAIEIMEQLKKQDDDSSTAIK